MNISSSRSRLAVLSLGLGAFASVTAEFLPVGVLPQVAADFGVSEGSAGLMMTLPGIMAALAAPGVMMLAGRSDRRRILLALSAILLAACLLSATATSFPAMLLGRAMAGVSLGAFWALGLAVAVRLVPPAQAHGAAATVFAGVTAAMILGVPLGTLVAEHYSWRGGFVAAALIAAVALVCQFFALPATPADSPLQPSALLRFATRPATRRSMLMIALVFAAHFGTYTFVAPLLQQSGIAAGQITLILLGYGVAGFVANFIASRYVGPHLQRTLLTAKALLLVSLLVLPWLNAAPLAQVAVVVLWGMAWGAMPLSLNSWHRSIAGADAEAASAMFTCTAQVAIALGSGAGGVIVDHAGISAAFWTGAVTVLLSIVVLLGRRRATQAATARCAEAG